MEGTGVTSRTEYEAASRQLFKEWKSRLNDGQHIGIDGAVNPCTYYPSRLRILFILKEIHHLTDKDDNLVKHLREDPVSGKTWNNVVRWTEMIRQVFGDGKVERSTVSMDKDITAARRHDVLQDIAVINMKKVPGGATSNTKNIVAYSQAHGDLLERQIKLLDPDVIVACGVYLSQLPAFKKLKYGDSKSTVFEFDGYQRIVIKASHPQAHKRSTVMLNEMERACKAIPNRGSHGARRGGRT
jgi:hypothetical protein